MKTTILSLAFLVCCTAYAQLPSEVLASTNLADKLHTNIEYDKTSGIDIRRLNLDSIHADKHKARMTTVKDMAVKDMAVNVIKPTSIVMVHPYFEKDDSGKKSKILNKFINVHALSINDNKNIIIDSAKTRKLLVLDLNPSMICIKDNIIVVDSNLYSVDKKWANANVTDETYAQLAEMKMVYSFEQDYNESVKTAVRLKDLMSLDRPMYLKWIKLLSQNKKCSIKFIKNTKLWKIGGEAWIFNNIYTAIDKNVLTNNICFLKSKDYNAVLVRFDCTEDIDLLLNLIDDIKTTGMEVFCAYVGIDNRNPSWLPYIEPEIIDKYFAAVASKSAGLLLNWRTTSNHVRILPIEYFNYISMLARKYNPQILIYGEAYYGVISSLYMTTLVYTVPENATGLVINNMGYYGYNFKYIINGMFTSMIPNYKKLNKICQVVGVAPYYCSRPKYKQDLTLLKEYEYKDKIEKGFRKIGCSTITMLHDGVDDNYTKLFEHEKDLHAVYDTIDNIVYDTKIIELTSK